jgi:hypothetical protein
MLQNGGLQNGILQNGVLRHHLWILGASLWLAGSAAAAPKLCPVSGKEGDPQHALFHEGKALEFCCGECLDGFRGDHENRLTKEEKVAGWKLIFNGKSLDGFQKPTRTGKWNVKGGRLVGAEGQGVLGTAQPYENFTFRADVRVYDSGGKRRGNSGVFLRSTGLTALRGKWPDGPEVQVDHGDPNYWTGAIWKTAKAKAVTTKDGHWFQLKVDASGPQLKVWVDGKLVTDHKLEGTVHAGPISFQVHHPTDVVEFKNVKVVARDAKAPSSAK